MAYRFSPLESIERGVQRAAVEQLDLALDKLGGEGDLDTRVHDVRKHLKKLRGLVRLVRFEIGQECFERENACFRDAGGALSAARASAAWRACLDDLGERFALNPLTLKAARCKLIVLRGASVGDALGARLPVVAQTLAAAKTRVAAWPIRRDEWSVLGDGLTLTYARGRRAMKRAYAAPDDALFHEWRKRVKYHWCHVRLVQDLWHKPLKMRRRALKRLADLLGDDHDLSELKGVLAGPPGDGDRRFSELILLAEERQAELREDARHLGQRAYAERPKHLERRFATYFSAWRAHAEHRAHKSTGEH
jgi:CHAD domain